MCPQLSSLYLKKSDKSSIIQACFKSIATNSNIMADGSGGIMECFTLSGLIKILESCAAFTCVMLHRIGDQGNEVTYVLPKYSISYPT